jgi:flagellar protein FlaG
MNIDTQNTLARNSTKPASAGAGGVAAISPLDTAERPIKVDAGLTSQAKAESSGSEVGTKELKAAVLDINEYVQSIQRTLQFSIDDDTGTTVVKVLNSETQEVVRQFPPEEVLALARHLQESQEIEAPDSSGLILHARA